MIYQKIHCCLFFILVLISISFASKNDAIHFDSLNVVFLNHTKKDSIIFKYSYNGLNDILKVELFAFNKKNILKNDDLRRIKNLKIKSVELYEFPIENKKYELVLNTDNSNIIILSLFQENGYSLKIVNRREYISENRNIKYCTIKKIDANIFIGLAIEPILIKADFTSGTIKELTVNSFKKTTFFSEKELSKFVSYNVCGFEVDRVNDYFGRKYYKVFYMENGEKSFSIDLYQNGNVGLMHKGEVLAPPPINTPYPIKNK